MSNRVVCVQEEYLQRRHEHSLSGEISTPLRGRLFTPISGLGYRTASQRGITNQRGEFRYLKNEQVTFYLGKVDLPAANAGSTVTPYDMGHSAHESTNVVRLLQTLCTARNGILTLPADVAQNACQAIDFSLESRSFARQSAVVRLLGQLGCTLIDAAIAIETLDAMLARHIQDSYLNTAIHFWHTASPASGYRQSLNDVR